MEQLRRLKCPPQRFGANILRIGLYPTTPVHLLDLGEPTCNKYCAGSLRFDVPNKDQRPRRILRARGGALHELVVAGAETGDADNLKSCHQFPKIRVIEVNQPYVSIVSEERFC